jgi:GNAT superfamily N-acetyltransferase
MIEMRPITIAEAIPVRHTVLREGWPIEECFYPRDDEPKTLHFGAFKNGVLLSIASLYEERSPSNPVTAAVRLRGMATVRHAQGTGVGTALLRY